MNKTADVIIVGLGAMGSAAAQHLAQRGKSVLAFDQFTPPHSFGSSHGLSRMYRQAYWEDARYVPLLERAFDLWNALSRAASEPLFHVTRGISLGRDGGELISRTLQSARQFNLSHTLLGANELRRRYPVFVVESNTIGLLEQNAGYILPEAAIRQQLTLAEQAGAQLHLQQAVLDWQANAESVTVRTASGTYSAGHLVLTAGPWAPQILAELQLPLRVTRQVLYWLRPQANAHAFSQDRLPVFLFESDPGQPMVYGFPRTGPATEGVKVALHGSSEVCTPESIRREVAAEEKAAFRDRLRTTLPDLADGHLLRAETCLYTMTPDEHFILDHHPAAANVTIAAGFSGHGFKFAPVIGEVLADLSMRGSTECDLSLFSLNRFKP